MIKTIGAIKCLALTSCVVSNRATEGYGGGGGGGGLGGLGGGGFGGFAIRLSYVDAQRCMRKGHG